MRKYTELSSNIRGMVRSRRGWRDFAHDVSTIQGGSGREERLPNALAVLAAAEARFMFWLVKLSGCRPDGGYADEQAEHEAASPTLP